MEVNGEEENGVMTGMVNGSEWCGREWCHDGNGKRK
jgi:hypothetical protein